MRIHASFAALLASLPLAASAQGPSYTAQFLGAANHIDAMNESGLVVGWVSQGNARAFVAGPNHPYELLPLPAGMVSSYADDINDAGVIVGAVGPSYAPEYYLQGRAAKWAPDGAGGWTIEVLGVLPGHVASRAMAINNVGDIVGFSANGMFRFPVLFPAGGPVDLSSTGIFDPCDVNDQRVVVDQSSTAKKLNLNTMAVEDLGIPAGSYRATRAEAINDDGIVVGAAILATSTSCDRQAARHGDDGWEILSICGSNNSAYDINALGDVIMRLNLAVWVDLTGQGTHRVEDLIVTATGHWSVINSYGNAINDSRQIAVMATHSTNGQSGALLLTPEGASGVATRLPDGTSLDVSVAPNPFDVATTLRLELVRAGHAKVALHDVTGRRVAILFEGIRSAGPLSLRWDGRDASARELPNGVYFARIETEAGAGNVRVVKLR